MPDGSKVYATIYLGNTVSVVDTVTNTVTATVAVGRFPTAFGIFIQPGEPPVRFSGVPGNSQCHGKSAAALILGFGNLNAAAEALGFSSVKALQNAIWAFCRA
jgi:YVTN family beta-propeller protein